MTKSRVFISGIAGFLGSHLADYCLKEGHEVVGCDNLIGGSKDNVPEEVEFHKANCCILPAMKRLTQGCEVVYHCAATAYEGVSCFSPHLVTRYTYDSTVSLLTAAISNGCRRFVFCSSMARYGKQQTPFKEYYIPTPVDPYGIAKYASELTIESLARVHDIEYSIAVPHNIVGPRQKYDDPYRNVVSIFINRILQGLAPIIYGDGEQRRCFSYVEDVVPYLYQLGWGSHTKSQIVNLGPDEEFVSINKLARLLYDILDFNEPPIYFPDRPSEVKLAYCSSTRARELLGYQTKTSLEDTLYFTAEWIRSRDPKPFKYHLPLEIINEHTPQTWAKGLI